jgi:hypothetical protein
MAVCFGGYEVSSGTSVEGSWDTGVWSSRELSIIGDEFISRSASGGDVPLRLDRYSAVGNLVSKSRYVEPGSNDEI